MPTQLSDVVVPEIYTDYQAVNDPMLVALFNSGIIEQNPMLDQLADTGGDQKTIPFWNDIDPSDQPNLSDTTSNEATPDKITAGKQVAQMAYLNKGLSSYDLSGELAGSDPMQRIRNRFGRYWNRQWELRLIANAVGIKADNGTGDMVVDISASSSPGNANYFSRSAFVDAAFTMGDHVDVIQAVGVHSTIYKSMINNDDIDFIPDSEGNLTIPTYMGRTVIQSDQLPVSGSDATAKYTSILFGQGAFGYGQGEPRVPVEVEREAAKGTGGGLETLWERKSWLLHPFGYKVTAEPANQLTFTLSELRNAATWQRVVDRKLVPLAFLVTNAPT